MPLVNKVPVAETPFLFLFVCSFSAAVCGAAIAWSEETNENENDAFYSHSSIRRPMICIYYKNFFHFQSYDPDGNSPLLTAITFCDLRSKNLVFDQIMNLLELIISFLSDCYSVF